MNPRSEENQFALEYKYNTRPDFHFIRKGSEQDPLPNELRHDKSSNNRQDQFERDMENRGRKVNRPADFIVDSKGFIDVEESSGWNLLSFSH